MDLFKNKVSLTKNITIKNDQLVLISGPCAVESYDICYKIGQTIKNICQALDIAYIFKTSFDKANRTSTGSFRSVSINKSLGILERIQKKLKVPVLTDIHKSSQIEEVTTIIDVLQIPT